MSNPYTTTNAQGQFTTASDGYIQGMAIADPVARYALATGVYNPSASVPLYGGVAICEEIPASGAFSGGSMGGQLIFATVAPASPAIGTAGEITGFAVSDQGYNAVVTPQSPAPNFQPGMTAPFYRLHSGARIALQAHPSLVNDDGDPVTTQVSWDFQNQMLVPYAPAYTGSVITAATYSSGSGGRNTYTLSSDLSADLSAGVTVEISGIVATGGAAGASYNGQFVVVSCSSSTLVVTNTAGNPGTYSSGGNVLAGGGRVPLTILKISSANNLTIAYNAMTGNTTYQTTGTIAEVLLN